MSDVRVVPLGQVPEEAVVDLLKQSLGAEQLRTLEFWRWKHRQNPFGESPGCVAVDPRGRPVALRVFLRWQLRGPQGVLEAARAVDTATHPEWRRRGLFRKLTTAALQQLADDGVDLVFNTPNPRSLRGYLSMGWQTVGRLPLAIGVRRPMRLAWRRLFEDGDEALPPAGLQPCDEVFARPEVARLLEGPGMAPRGLSTSRSTRYYRWRYADMPSFRYGALPLREESVRAVGVFRLRRRSGALELSLSELLSDEPGVSGSQVGALCRQAATATNADYVVAMADPRSGGMRPGLPGVRPLRVRGPMLVVRLLGSSDSASAALKMANWSLSIGDMELF